MVILLGNSPSSSFYVLCFFVFKDARDFFVMVINDAAEFETRFFSAWSLGLSPEPQTNQLFSSWGYLVLVVNGHHASELPDI